MKKVEIMNCSYSEKKDKTSDSKENVKRYTPKKRSPLPFAGGDASAPSRMTDNPEPSDGIAEPDGGVTMTTSEILDFSEGTDSY